MLQNNIQNCAWIAKINSIFDITGNSFIFNNQTNVQCKTISKLIKRSLIDQFIQEWQDSVSNSSKGRNYQVYKQIFQFEEYLTTIPHSQAIIIFKLRTNNNKFPVETGRWKKPKTPLNERYCTLCNSGDIGDLYHYLFTCNNFKDIRNKSIHRYYRNSPNMPKFVELMQTTGKHSLIKLSKFAKSLQNHVQ